MGKSCIDCLCADGKNDRAYGNREQHSENTADAGADGDSGKHEQMNAEIDAYRTAAEGLQAEYAAKAKVVAGYEADIAKAEASLASLGDALADKQEELDAREYDISAGGGVVGVKINGKITDRAEQLTLKNITEDMVIEISFKRNIPVIEIVIIAVSSMIVIAASSATVVFFVRRSRSIKRSKEE